jgi:hypothetical protein
MEQSFGNQLSACVARTLFSCPSVSEPGTSNTTTSIEACASAITNLSSCADFANYLAANDGRLCPTVPGTLADGAACLDDSQCKGGFCGAPASDDGGTSSSACSACAEKPGVTNCQESSNCPGGQLCNANGTCVVAGTVGAVCDGSGYGVQPCQAALFCQFAASAADGGGAATGDAGAPAKGLCAALLVAGKTCDPTDYQAECANGLFCNPQGTCAAIQFVAIGAACDDNGLVCTASNCVFSDSADASATGTCTAYVSDGAACQSDTDCEYNAGCLNGSCSTAGPVCN